MLEYAVHGRIVELTASGSFAPGEWDVVYEAIRADVDVPEAALILIDTRAANIEMSSLRLIDRVANFRARLGNKMGDSCAIVTTPRNAHASYGFQHYATAIGLRVGVFDDPAAAKRWLESREPS